MSAEQNRKTMETARRSQRGFTLIELMVVVAIIGILAAIASTHFISYRLQAFDARANSDLRHAATAEEAYFVDTGTYITCADAACDANLPNFRRSNSVSLNMTATGGSSPSFVGVAQSEPGSRVFTWDSNTGGMVP